MAQVHSRRSRGSSARSALSLWLSLAGLIVVVDQLTKRLIVSRMQLGDAVAVSGWLDIVRAHNTGAAFSMLDQASGWQRWLFVGIAVLASALIITLLRRHSTQTLFAASITLILGGAIGNLIDRLLLGYVVDFIQVHGSWLTPIFRHGYFPAFNVADAAISLGAAGLLIDELRRVRRG